MTDQNAQAQRGTIKKKPYVGANPELVLDISGSTARLLYRDPDYGSDLTLETMRVSAADKTRLAKGGGSGKERKIAL